MFKTVIARSAATKQSSFPFYRAKAGLLRFARNDGKTHSRNATAPGLCLNL
jgi:hypothetical protein